MFCSHLDRNITLACLARGYGLYPVNPRLTIAGSPVPRKIEATTIHVATMFEAVVGALSLDEGKGRWELLDVWISSVFSPNVFPEMQIPAEAAKAAAKTDRRIKKDQPLLWIPFPETDEARSSGTSSCDQESSVHSDESGDAIATTARFAHVSRRSAALPSEAERKPGISHDPEESDVGRSSSDSSKSSDDESEDPGDCPGAAQVGGRRATLPSKAESKFVPSRGLEQARKETVVATRRGHSSTVEEENSTQLPTAELGSSFFLQLRRRRRTSEGGSVRRVMRSRVVCALHKLRADRI